jgi:ribonuclease III
MYFLDSLRKNISLIEEKIGYVFENKELLVLSLIHRSFVNEHKSQIQSHNERLEFLGDSVLGLITADFLYHRLPSYPEGPLSQLRSRLVDAQACAHYFQKLGLQEFILLGRGEAMSDGKAKVSILADAFEALVGAVFIDGGSEIVKSFFLCHFEQDMEAVIGSPSRNYKAELQDYSQKKYKQAPVYKVVQETGPDHAKVFHVVVMIDEKEAGMGLGESKKVAEQKAAFEALSKLETHE